MTPASVARAREYVARVPIAHHHTLRAATRGGTTEAMPGSILNLAFDTTKSQAAIAGSDIISFVQGVSAERRDAIVHSSLLAQQVASKNVPDRDDLFAWYDQYFDVLDHIGWVIQEKSFQQFEETSENFEAHKAIIAMATQLLGAAPAALALVKTTLDSLESMAADSPWITIFNRESQHARSARFQVSLAQQDPNGQFLITLMAFALEASSSITQVLFFRTKSNEASLRHSSGTVTIDTAVLDGVSDAIKQKLVGIAQDYIKALPDL